MLDLTGKRFGRLLAICPTEQRKRGNIVWKCQCDCGRTSYVIAGKLARGGTQSCGCTRKESLAKEAQKNIADLTGQRFGRLIAVRPTEERRQRFVVWECKCDCGNTVHVTSGMLKCGNTSSCGCLRKEIATKNRLKSVSKAKGQARQPSGCAPTKEKE